MAIINISTNLSSQITTKINEIKTCSQQDIDNFLQLDNDFTNIYKSAKKILNENYYLVIKNIGFVKEKSIFEAFVKLFGEFYGEVEYTDIKLDCSYTGCSYKLIELHNDDAIDLDNQPLYGFIQVHNEDPLKLSQNGLVKVDDIVNYLAIYDKNFLDELFTRKIPMLSYGVNYDNRTDNEIITNESILYKNGDSVNIRFDLTRVKHYYWKKEEEQSLGEKYFIDKFLTIAKKFRKEIYLEKGDILIHNNKKTLHDRTECSFELNVDGSFNTREIFVSFVRDNYNES
jgi:hypothetical protein